jgi:hypothetical protein
MLLARRTELVDNEIDYSNLALLPLELRAKLWVLVEARRARRWS